jgi:hypothetical protein
LILINGRVIQLGESLILFFLSSPLFTSDFCVGALGVMTCCAVFYSISRRVKIRVWILLVVLGVFIYDTAANISSNIPSKALNFGASEIRFEMESKTIQIIWF